LGVLAHGGPPLGLEWGIRLRFRLMLLSQLVSTSETGTVYDLVFESVSLSRPG